MLLLKYHFIQKKERKRGYNQLTTCAQYISEQLEVPVLENVLQKVSDNKTQTYKSKEARFLNAKEMYTITNTATLQNKHILLIDDVITTGATLHACCTALLETENISISIFTMAYTV